jgi:hypothetical protein
MKLDVMATLRDAWGLFRRDHDLLIRLAAPFLFWPALALGLLVPLPPTRDGAGGVSDTAWIDSVSAWASQYGGWYFAAYAFGMIGTAAALALQLGEGQPSIAQALGRALKMMPRFLLAMLLVALPVGAGTLLLVVPGLYIAGRLALVGPVLFAERRMAALAAMARSVTLTRGAGLSMAALASCTYLGGIVAGQPFLALVEVVKGDGGAGNPVAIALLQAGAAAVAMAAGLAQTLISVAAYRRLVNR